MIFKLTITSPGADPSIKILNSVYLYSTASLLTENFILVVTYIKKQWPFNTNIEIKLSIVEAEGVEKMLLKTDQYYGNRPNQIPPRTSETKPKHKRTN